MYIYPHVTHFTLGGKSPPRYLTRHYEEQVVATEDKTENITGDSSNAIEVFSNSEFGSLRTIMIDGEPWFVGKDVATVLGYKETAKAIREHVDTDDKGVSKMDTPGGMQELTIINESGLYSLILSSKLPSAKKFKRWVTSEVLPSLRKHGGYIVGQETMSTEELLSRAL